MPGPIAREKKVSAFKTISFLESLPENERGTSCSDKLIVDEDDRLSYPLPGEKTLPATSLPGNSGRDISGTKKDIVDYPGRSVLYSHQFRPLNRISSTEYQHPGRENHEGWKETREYMPETVQGKFSGK